MIIIARSFCHQICVALTILLFSLLTTIGTLIQSKITDPLFIFCYSMDCWLMSRLHPTLDSYIFFISRTSRNRCIGSKNGQVFLLFLMPPSVTTVKALSIFTVLTLKALCWNNACKQILCLNVQYQISILQTFALREFLDSKYAIKYSLSYRTVS